MPLRGSSQLKGQKYFFVTTSTKDKKHLFNDSKKLNSLRKIILTAIDKFDAELIGYVLMTNHFHLLLYVPDGGPQLSLIMQNIKSVSSKVMFPGIGGIWEPRFDDVAIYTEDVLRVKLEYIHNNPMKAGLVDKPEDYEFSSARKWINS